MRRARRRIAIGGLAALIAIAASPPAWCESAEEIAQSAAAAPNAAALETLARRLDRFVTALDAAGPGSRLDAATDALGKLVMRARELGVGTEGYDRLLSLGRDLGARIGDGRERLEAEAGEDEAALERLYRSDAWQRLDYGDAMLGYWTGWTQLYRAQTLPAGPERAAAMRAAQAAFSRSALELGLPGIATASLLGLGMARHDLGDLDGARSALERLAQSGGGVDAALRDAARTELASIAFERGDIERGRALVEQIPPDQLDRPRRLDLQLREAEGWIRRAEGGQPGAERAAALLREVIAAGGDFARRAAALVEQHWSALAEQDVGPLGDLLSAEAAFAAGRFAEARDAYARALADPAAVPGLEPSTARYKYARSLAESGRRDAAMAELEKLLAGGGGAAVRGPAAVSFYSLAESAAAAEPGPANDARALRAAEILLAAAPESPGAGTARLRVARAREARGRAAASLEELAGVPASSPAYPGARLDMARLRAARLQQLDASGRLAGAEGRSTARALLGDLDAVEQLIAAGRLPREPARDATLAVFRAKAAAASGAPAAEVIALLDAAAARPGQDAAARAAILRLRLRTLARAGRFDELGRALAAQSDAALRADWPLWLETLRALEARPAPPAALLAWYARLEPLAPESERGDLALGRARALLAAGRSAEAADAAGALTAASPTWGDAWLLQARALDAAGDDPAAYRAWKTVADGVEPGSDRWVDATLGAAEAARRSGDLERSCRTAAALDDPALELDERQRARLAGVSGTCPPASGPGDTRVGPARSDSSGRPRDLR